jgi:hypothetical protein
MSDSSASSRAPSRTGSDALPGAILSDTAAKPVARRADQRSVIRLFVLETAGYAFG